MKKFTIKMKNGDLMIGELYEDVAPVTVENFKKLADSGFYDGLIFHRVIPGFMIQGGCPNGNGRGVLSMARAMDPNSGGSQFFIMVEDAPHLDGQYAAFGKVSEGMETADKIVSVETDNMDKPKKDQIIETIIVE